MRPPGSTAVPAPAAYYILCSTPRTGSWLLAEALQRSGVAGSPKEYFGHTKEGDDPGTNGDRRTFDARFRRALTEARTPNGVVGIKAHIDQLAHLLFRLGMLDDFAGVSQTRLMETVLPGVRYIWMRRRDPLRQAISYHRALRSGVWFRLPGDADAPGHEAAPFDAGAIARALGIVSSHDAMWRDYFDATGSRPLCIYYEDLAADYGGAVRSVLRHVGVPADEIPAIPPPRLRRQADDLTEEWVRRMRGGRVPSGSRS